MKKLRTLHACVAAMLLAGCASDGAHMAPIEAREVRRQPTTVSGSGTAPAPVPAARPANPEAPKVMALPDTDRASVTPMALPTPAPQPLPVPGAMPAGDDSPQAPMAAPTPPPAAAPAEEPVSTQGSASPAESRKDTRPAAVRQLLQEAEAARQAADFVRARAVLERGVKLAPREPELWYRLAEVAFAERDWEQCQSLAQRAASLAREAPDLRVKAQALEQAALAKGTARAAP